MLRSAALFDNSAPAMYKKVCVLRTLSFIHQKGQHLSALELYKNQSPNLGPIFFTSTGGVDPYGRKLAIQMGATLLCLSLRMQV